MAEPYNPQALCPQSEILDVIFAESERLKSIS